MGNTDSKSLEDYQLHALLEEAAAPVDSSSCGGAAAGTAEALHGAGQVGAGGSRLKRLLEANLSSKDIGAVLGTREDVQHLVAHRSQALLCLLDQLIALVSATADAASQSPITPAQSSTLLTALRLLTLLLPVLLESRELEQLLFWTPHPRCPRAYSGSSTGSSRRASTRNAAALEGEQDGPQSQQLEQQSQPQQQQEQQQQHDSRVEEEEERGGSAASGEKTEGLSPAREKETQEKAATGERAQERGDGEDETKNRNVRDAGEGDDSAASVGAAAESSNTSRDSRVAGVAASLEGKQRRSSAADSSDFSGASEQSSTAADSQSAAAAAGNAPQKREAGVAQGSGSAADLSHELAAASAGASASGAAAADAPSAAAGVGAAPVGESGTASSGKPAAAAPRGSPRKGGGGATGVAGLLRCSTTVGQDILNQLFRMLFLPGFTVLAPGYRLLAAAALERGEGGGGAAASGGEELLARLPRHKLDVALLWRAGIGATEADLPPALSRVPGWMLSNRMEVIHCLLACFAGPLYESLDEYQLHVPQWVRLATAGNVPYTANLFCSLLSTACAAEAVGSSRMLGLFGSPETQQLTTAVVQLLVVLLDFNVSVFVNPDGTPMVDQERKPREARAAGGRGGQRGPSGPPLRNVFRSMVVGLQREEEFDFIYEGIAKHLEAAAARCCKGSSRASAVGPGGKPDLFCEQLLILTWQLLTLNGNFLRHICAKRGAHHLLHPLVCLLLDASRYMHRHRQPQQRRTGDEGSNSSSKERATAVAGGDDADAAAQARQTDEASSTSGEAASALSMIGLLHVSSFILLVLSSERDFAVRLNEPFTGKKTPAELPVFNGCYADLLCLAVHRVIMDATGPRGSSESLVDMLLTVLCNVSAYVKSFCLESCMRLMNLMEKLSRRQWLLSAPQHHHDVCFLLDVFNNIIQYQYEGNRQLVYSILRHKQLFLDLQNMTLEGGEGAEASEWTRRERQSNVSNSSSSGGDGSPGRDSDARVMNGTAGAQGSASVDTAEPAEKRREGSGNAEEAQGQRGGWNRPATEDDEEEPWVPTEAWFDEWKSRLPLQTILRLIKCLLPQVEAEVARREATDQKDILQFLEKTTMVGLLPVPHPIIIRNYQPNVYTALWFTSFMWGVLLAACPALQGVNWREIRLIVVYP